MPAPLDRQLDTLKKEKKALEKKIRSIQRKLESKDKKRKQSQYPVVGQVIMDALEKGESLSFSSTEELLSFLDERVKVKTQRRLFGFEIATDTKDASASKGSKKDAEQSPVEPPVEPETELEDGKEADTQKKVTPRKGRKPSTRSGTRKKTTSSRTSRKKPLPETDGQDDLMKEFNI